MTNSTIPIRGAVVVGLLAIAPALLLAQAQAPTGFAKRFEEIKTAATKEEMYRLLWALPKGGDIHNHHEYSVPMADWLALGSKKPYYYTRVRLSDCGPADAYRLQYVVIRESSFRELPPCVQQDYKRLAGLTPAEREAWISALQLDHPGEGRDEFFERAVSRIGALEQDAELMPELLVHQLRQSAAENVRYIETQAYPPHFVDGGGSVLTPTEAADRYRRRLAAPDALATGVAVRLQAATVRFTDDAPQRIARAYELAYRNRDLWVGVNIVGREDYPNSRAARFVELFRDLRRRYPDVHLSLHGGESDQPGREVRETLFLGAERIGHGTNLLSDPETTLFLRGNRYLIEVSLVSSQLLEYVPDLGRHPFPEFLRLGIPVCLNTDDRGVFDSNMTDEYFLAVTLYNLSWDEVVRIGRYSLEFSFAEPALKQKLLASYDADVAAFVQKHDREDWRGSLKSVHAAPSGYASRRLGL